MDFNMESIFESLENSNVPEEYLVKVMSNIQDILNEYSHFQVVEKHEESRLKITLNIKGNMITSITSVMVDGF